MPKTLQLTAADGFACPAYVARPAGKPKGAIVVIQEIFGVNVHIRAVADGYAADGYLAIAPHTFHRVQAGVDLGYTADDVAVGRALKDKADALPGGGPLQDIQAAVNLGAKEAGKVGVVGYCWGGTLVWRAAEGVSGLSAAVSYYGGGTTAPAEVGRDPKCPTMCHYGEQDHGIPMAGVRAFEAKHPRVMVHVYPAQHGFNCDMRGSYDAPSAKLARERTLAFVAKHVG